MEKPGLEMWKDLTSSVYECSLKSRKGLSKDSLGLHMTSTVKTNGGLASLASLLSPAVLIYTVPTRPVSQPKRR